MACPGMLRVEVVDAGYGSAMLVPGIEVLLFTMDGEVVRAGFTDNFGEAAFVVEQGPYIVSCTLDGVLQERMISIGCNQAIDPLRFYF